MKRLPDDAGTPGDGGVISFGTQRRRKGNGAAAVRPAWLDDALVDGRGLIHANLANVLLALRAAPELAGALSSQGRPGASCSFPIRRPKKSATVNRRLSLSCHWRTKNALAGRQRPLIGQH